MDVQGDAAATSRTSPGSNLTFFSCQRTPTSKRSSSNSRRSRLPDLGSFIESSLTVTISWFTPILPKRREYRAADLWCSFDNNELDLLGVSRTEGDHRAVQRGTVQHEILEGNRATVVPSNMELTVQVNCRMPVAGIAEYIPYAIAISLETAPALGLPIYEKVSERIQPKIDVRAR